MNLLKYSFISSNKSEKIHACLDCYSTVVYIDVVNNIVIDQLFIKTVKKSVSGRFSVNIFGIKKHLIIGPKGNSEYASKNNEGL